MRDHVNRYLRAFAVTLLLTSGSAKAEDTVELRNLIQNSVVKVQATDCESTGGGSACANGLTSTGFFWNHPSLGLVIATTLHGVAFYPRLAWRSASDKPEYLTSIVAVNPGADLALLNVDEAEVTELGYVPLNLSEDRLEDIAGKTVVTAGFKLGLESVTTDVNPIRIKGPTTLGELPLGWDEHPDWLVSFLNRSTRTLQIQNRLDPGDSGGPVLLSGVVVGIAHAGLVDSSINWAIPAEYLRDGMDTDPASVAGFLAGARSRDVQQSRVIRFFNAEEKTTERRAARAPVQYSFALAFNLNTRLLQEYSFRSFDVRDTDYDSGWTFMKTPIPTDSEAFPTAREWREAGGVENYHYYDYDEPKRALLIERLDAEQRFWDVLQSSMLRIECHSQEDMVRARGLGADWLGSYPSFRLDHLFSDLSTDLANGAIQIAAESLGGSLYLYTRELRSVDMFGRRGTFQRAFSLTDQDLDKALCSLRFVPINDRDQLLLGDINASLRSGDACFIIFFGQDVAMEMVMAGQVFDAALDQSRLYGTLAHVNSFASGFGESCTR